MAKDHEFSNTTPAAADHPSAVLELDSISKTYGLVQVLKPMSLALWPGEVLALMGENGAGKSTCVKLIAGLIHPTTGHIVIGGKPVAFASARDARDAGIAVIHQHPSLFPDLSIAENIFAGRLPQKGGIVDFAEMAREAARVLALVGLERAPDTQLSALRASEQQLVEIARSLSIEARVLILDEPTASLSVHEVDRLFGVIDRLRTAGVAMMFIGHRMDEIFRVADRVAVLRDGALIDTRAASDLDRDSLIQMMVGRSLANEYPQIPPPRPEVALSLRDVAWGDRLKGVTFDLHAGEVLGVGGLVGSGRSEIARLIFGVTHPTTGQILVAGEPVSFAHPGQAMEAGIAYVSEDRLGQSLVLEQSILDNVSLPTLGRAAHGPFVSRQRQLALVAPALDRMSLRYRSYDQPVGELSGGNQQKVAIAKWLASKPRVLILDEPTQGIDVQAKAEVHALIAQLADAGIAVLMISSEMPELIGMCHRVIVMREGEQAGILEGEGQTAAGVMTLAARWKSDSSAAGASEQAVRHLSLAHRVMRYREMGLVAAILAVLAPMALVNPAMFSAANISTLSMDVALLAIMALGQMLVLLTRNIDLSVASIVGLSAYGAAVWIEAYPQYGVIAGILVAVTIGLVAGLVNGTIVAYGRVPSIVATLGSLTVFRGFNALWANGRQISADKVTQDWLDMTTARLAGIPLIVLMAAAMLCLGWLILSRTTFGRAVYAVGSNPEGARVIGIDQRRLVLAAFTLAGGLAGLAGALWASRYATVDARTAYGYELQVIAAAIVGGIAIRGGAGSVAGLICGCLLLLVIRNALNLIPSLDPLALPAFFGAVIVGAVIVDQLMARRADTERRGAR